MKMAYDACMNVDLLKVIGLGPLSQILTDITNNFPVQSSSLAPMNVAESQNTRDAILYLARLGVTALVSSRAEPDSRDPDTVVVTVSAPYSVGLPAKERYLDKKLVKKYHQAMSQVLSSLYSQHSWDDASLIVELEKKLAAASPESQDRDNITVGLHSLQPLTVSNDVAANLQPNVLEGCQRSMSRD
jgi:endothelin-converting enzyme